MCLAIPALIVSVDGNSRANVDFGQGVLRDVNVSLVNVKVGDYVIVHAGYAIQVIKEDEAKETLRIWREVLENDKQ
jgi:hydrogenase expression/formation protein HypC